MFKGKPKDEKAGFKIKYYTTAQPHNTFLDEIVIEIREKNDSC